MLVLSFTCSLVSQARPNQCQRGSHTDWSDLRWRWLGLRLARLPCLYASVHLWPAFMPFGLLVNHSACVQAVRPAFKPFGLVFKWDHFALHIESGPTSLKTGWPVYKPVARLQTGQVCNWFTTCTPARLKDNLASIVTITICCWSMKQSYSNKWLHLLTYKFNEQHWSAEPSAQALCLS